MQAVELETTISAQGEIALPAQWRDLYGRHARVILLLADEPGRAGPARRRAPSGPATLLRRDSLHKPRGKHDASL
jgi:bifunctional DNA-binding transcriptional regulator/antitoxin component of YhaV-PrlF toxin-antitoxin module